MNISKNIFSIREAKGIKQYQVAELLGIEPPNYSRLEKRGDKLTIEQLEKIAVALGVSVKELLFNEKEEDKEDIPALKSRIAELESIIKDKEQINRYLSDKQALCGSYLKEVLDEIFYKIALDENSFGTIVYLKNGKEEKVTIQSLQENKLTEAELDEIHFEGFIRYEFTEDELDRIMRTLFRADKHKAISTLIMWTGTISEPKYVNAFKKYGVRSNVSIKQLKRMIESPVNSLGVKDYESKVGVIFE